MALKNEKQIELFSTCALCPNPVYKNKVYCKTCDWLLYKYRPKGGEFNGKIPKKNEQETFKT